MKKTALKKALRTMAADVAVYESNKTTDDEKQKAALDLHKHEQAIKDDGHTFRTETHYGKRGIMLYECGIKVLWFAEIPLHVKRQQKPRVVVYDADDITLADYISLELNRAETLESVEFIEKKAEEINSASLLGDILVGCARIHKEIKANMKEEPAQKEEQASVDMWAGCTVYQKNENSCIWVSGDTKPHRDELKSLGYRWSKKRKAWYLKPAA